ncbi:hypothetical protein [Streptomyces griseosporeus]|uniref:hypothetical protein n=1 Tax=Streptomyces griseosporeus TaxID=1910 RepID=UPI0036FF04B3
MADSDEATHGSTLQRPDSGGEHGPRPARGAVIEIVEKGRATDDTTAGSLIVPDEIRINGQPLLSPRECPVKVHEMQLDDSSLVCVTLTLLARRVSVRAEHDHDTPPTHNT